MSVARMVMLGMLLAFGAAVQAQEPPSRPSRQAQGGEAPPSRQAHGGEAPPSRQAQGGEAPPSRQAQGGEAPPSQGAEAAKPEDAATWIERLVSPETRDTARDKLRDLGPAAIPALVASLKYADPVIRSESAFVLGRIGRKDSVRPLIDALGDLDARVRANAAYALGEISDARAMEPLVKRLSDADALVRANACFALGHVGDPAAAPELVKALTDPDEDVRNFAASALGAVKEPRALPALAWVARRDASSDVRALAATSMGALKDKRACATLVALLEDKDYVVRAQSIEALLALTRERRGYEARESDAARAEAIARWKTWLARQKFAPLEPLAPAEVYDAWPGRPKPELPAEPPAETPDALVVPAAPVVAAPVMSARPRDAAPTLATANPAAAALFAAGRANLDARNFAAAALNFESCLKLVPATKEAMFNLALCRVQQDRVDAAIEMYRALLALEPKDAGCGVNLGALLERQGKSDEAERFYREALDGFGEKAAARWNLAELLMRAGKVAEPRRLYEALDASPARLDEVDRALVKVRLATCLRRYGEEDRARVLFAEATASTKDAALVREAARQFAAMRDFPRAKALLDRAYRETGGDAESAWALAAFLLRVPDATLRDIAKASFYAEAAITAKPADERFISIVAEAAWACGEKTKAVEILENALKTHESESLKKQLEDYRKTLAPAEEKAESPKKEAEGETPAGP